jgi:hypothetical protein
MTGAANFSAVPQPLTPRIVRPQQTGWSKPGRRKMVGDVARRLLKGWRFELSALRRSLDQLPAGEAGSGSSGVFRHPNREGLPVAGAGFGALRSFPVYTPVLSSGHSCRSSSREAPSGLRFAPTGLRADAALGRGESTAAGRGGEKAKRPVPCSARGATRHAVPSCPLGLAPS